MSSNLFLFRASTRLSKNLSNGALYVDVLNFLETVGFGWSTISVLELNEAVSSAIMVGSGNHTKSKYVCASVYRVCTFTFVCVMTLRRSTSNFEANYTKRGLCISSRTQRLANTNAGRQMVISSQGLFYSIQGSKSGKAVRDTKSGG